jgi:periplasmic divalent cation tolerance protein
MTDEQLCEVILSAPDGDWLAEFVRGLVVDRLAASGHTLASGRSVYEWDGEVIERTEARASVRTRTALVDRIAQRLDDEHPYDVPGIVAVALIATSPAYGRWLSEQTASPRATDAS